ncbi:MAG TPA: hypothetical protein PKW55_02510 [Spirochaetota bacterium]|nr:hypothetical protein [Spirochaetota bacterium]HOM38279.1 hypothetical protein [Spirochaetota bacterium]HPQ48503.1 hypothetical protein [Spirochaetota bacterium]
MVTAKTKALFAKKEQEYKLELERHNIFIKDRENEIAANPNDPYNPYRQIAIANELISIVTINIQITEDMEMLKGVRNESYLTEGRSSYYKALIVLEKVFTDFVNADFTEIQKIVESIPYFDPARKIIFFRRMGFVLDRLEKSFGEKSKYKWSFADMFSRYAVVFKNAMNYKELAARDPRKWFFEENEILANMVVELLNKSADRLRQKYEMSTKQFDDMNRAIKILEELRKVHTMLNEHAAGEEVKKKIDVWKDKLNKDMEEKKKGKK